MKRRRKSISFEGSPPPASSARGRAGADPVRRALLKTSAAGVTMWLGLDVGLSLLLPGDARAEWPAQGYAAKTADAAIATLFGDSPLRPSERIVIDLPELAEDGAVVPVTVTADLPAVQSLYLIGEKNPVPLIARFDFGAGAMNGYIATRIKLADSGHLIAIAQTEGGLYTNRKHIKVTKGGCD